MKIFLTLEIYVYNSVLQTRNNCKEGLRDGEWRYFLQQRSDVLDEKGNTKIDSIVSEYEICREYYKMGRKIK